MQIALDVLEPLGRIARRVLQPQHFQPALVLVAGKGAGHVLLAVQIVRQRDGAFQRQLGAGADREMRGRRRVAEQHDIAGRPALAQHAVEVEPGRAAQMLGVRHQRVAVEMGGEDFLAGGDGLFGVHFVEAGLAPGFFRAFDDEGRGVGIELIGVRPDPAVLGLFEDEREGLVELLAGAEPDVFAGAHVDVGLEHVGIGRAHARVHPVGADDQVVALQLIQALHLGLEAQVDAELTRPLLQNFQEPHAADAGKAVAARAHHRAAVMHGDVVPIDEGVADRRRADRIVGVEIAERVLRQHHAPAEGVVRPVALEHHDLVRGIAQFQRNREIKPARAAPQNCRTHRPAPSWCQADSMPQPRRYYKHKIFMPKVFPLAALAQASLCRERGHHIRNSVLPHRPR